MKINEAVAQAMLTNERAFKDIPEAQAIKMVKATLAELAKEIDATDEGKISVPGFATFTVKQVEREKDGEKSARKRIVVRLKTRKSEDSPDGAEDDGDDE